MKNFIANVPLYIGFTINSLSLQIGKFGNKLLELSLALHLRFDTELGKEVKRLKQSVMDKLEAIEKRASEASKAKNPLEAALSKPTTTIDKELNNIFTFPGNKPTREN